MRGRFSPKGLDDAVALEERGVHSTVDLRSDTVTRPSLEMRRAMMMAEVGDDVYGEDPTVRRLEERAAEIFARPAALFVPTGTMGNQIAVHVHARPGQEIVCESRSHLYNLEMGMAAAFSGCWARPVAAPDGRLGWAAVGPHLHLDAPYNAARTGLVVVENTHSWAGGVPTPAALSEDLCARLHERGVLVHLDGARIFNAAVALGTTVAELARPFDSVMFCLSKGLGAPVGSMLAGSEEFIHRARIARKMLGGGMRQAGILAAAGLIALEKGPARLAEDHANAALLAAGLAESEALEIDPARVMTNIVVFRVVRSEFSAAEVVERLRQRNVLAATIGSDTIRLVTHLDADRAQCLEALSALRAILNR